MRMTHPRRPVNRPASLEKLRGVCLSLPETIEKEAWGGPTFRVKGRMFAMYMDNHHGDGRVALWCNAAADERDAIVAGESIAKLRRIAVGDGMITLQHDGFRKVKEGMTTVEEVLQVAGEIMGMKDV